MTATPPTKHATSEEVIAEIRRRSSKTLLAFSAGKDSIAAWLAIRDHFEEIVPFYMYLVPGNLEFIEESLDYYERFFGTRIVRMPNTAIYRLLNANVFQPPERLSVLQRIDFQEPDKEDVAYAVAADHGLDPETTYNAIGVRANDSIMRRLSIQKHGAINEKTKHYYPVFDWNMERLVSEIKRSGCKLPIDYKLFGRSFDGLDLRFIYQIKQHFPRDYQRILEWFPMVEVELWRYEFARNNHQ